MRHFEFYEACLSARRPSPHLRGSGWSCRGRPRSLALISFRLVDLNIGPAAKFVQCNIIMDAMRSVHGCFAMVTPAFHLKIA